MKFGKNVDAPSGTKVEQIQEDDGKMKWSTIALIALGSIALFVIIIFAIRCIIRLIRRSKRAERDAMEIAYADEFLTEPPTLPPIPA